MRYLGGHPIAGPTEGEQSLLVSGLRQVEKTAIFALWCRSVDALADPSILNDPVAPTILEKLNFRDVEHFEKLDARKATGTVCLRSLVFDEKTRSFIDAMHSHSDDVPVVVELGCGFNTRLERLGEAVQYCSVEVDLPLTAVLRNRLLPKSGRQMIISGSLLQDDWALQLAQRLGSRPKLFLLEGVSFYFLELQFRSLIHTLGKNFPGSWLMFDSLSTFWEKHAQYDPLRKIINAPYRWFIDDPEEIESWNSGIELLDSSTWRDFPSSIRNHVEREFPTALSCDEIAEAYRINVVRVNES